MRNPYKKRPKSGISRESFIHQSRYTKLLDKPIGNIRWCLDYGHLGSTKTAYVLSSTIVAASKLVTTAT